MRYCYNCVSSASYKINLKGFAPRGETTVAEQLSDAYRLLVLYVCVDYEENVVRSTLSPTFSLPS